MECRRIGDVHLWLTLGAYISPGHGHDCASWQICTWLRNRMTEQFGNGWLSSLVKGPVWKESRDPWTGLWWASQGPDDLDLVFDGPVQSETCLVMTAAVLPLVRLCLLCRNGVIWVVIMMMGTGVYRQALWACYSLIPFPYFVCTSLSLPPIHSSITISFTLYALWGDYLQFYQSPSGLNLCLHPSMCVHVDSYCYLVSEVDLWLLSVYPCW